MIPEFGHCVRGGGKSCENQNCNECHESGMCLECAYGMTLNRKNECVDIKNENCHMTFDDKTCAICKDGFHITEDNDCVEDDFENKKPKLEKK